MLSSSSAVLSFVWRVTSEVFTALSLSESMRSTPSIIAFFDCAALSFISLVCFSALSIFTCMSFVFSVCVSIASAVHFTLSAISLTEFFVPSMLSVRLPAFSLASSRLFISSCVSFLICSAILLWLSI